MPEEKSVTKCIIKIDGKNVAQGSTGQKLQSKDGWFIENIQVDKKIDCPDMFSIDFQMRADEKIIILDEIKEGKSVEILVGYTDEKTIFKGEILYIEPHFRFRGPSTVTISGYDRMHRLTRGTSSRTWGDGIQDQDLYSTSIQDVVSKAQEYTGTSDSLTTEKIEPPNVKFKYMPQLNVSDYLFIKNLGIDADKKTDADTVKDDKKVSFYKVQPAGSPIVTLCKEKLEGTNPTFIKDVHLSLSTIRQYKRVEVRGWDPKKKKNIVGVAEESDYNFGGTPGWKATGKALYGSDSKGKVLTIVDHPVDSKEEADSIAKAIFNQLSMDFITGEAEFQGNPDITTDQIVELKQFGERFSGKYLIIGCTHIINPASTGYTTTIRFVRNDVMKV